jgi:hypothetical protein
VAATPLPAGPARDRRAGVADLLAVAAGAGAFALVAARALRVPITHDEAFSYLRFVAVPAAEAFSFRGTDAANNHVLLTALDRLLVAALGPSEIVLRLPVVAAFVASMVASWRLLRGRTVPAVALAGLLVIGLNRLGVELFSLARGYGLGAGLALCGLGLVVRAVEEDLRPLPALGGLSLLVLAALAQLTFLDVWAGASAALLLVGAARSLRRGDGPAAAGGGLLRAARLVLPPALACGATAIPLAIAMRSGGALYAGGRNGLVADTLATVVRETLEPARWAEALKVPVALAAVLATAFVALAVLALLASREGPGEGAAALLVGATYLFSLLAVAAQARLLGVGYPVDRMAWSFVPLLVLSTCLAAGRLLRRSGRLLGRVAHGIAAIAAAGAVVQLAATADVSRSRLWWFDADTPKVLEEVARRVAPGHPGTGTVSLGASWILEPGLNYYRLVRGLSWLQPVDRTGLSGLRDVYVVASPDAGGEESSGLATVAAFERAGTRLAFAGPERLGAVARLAAEGALPAPDAGRALAPPARVAWVPVVVRAGGLDGAAWRSDLRIVNRSGTTATVLVGTRWKGELRQGVVGVGPGAAITLADVAGQLGVEGSGPLEVRSAGDVDATASVYDAARRPGPSTEAGSWLRAARPGTGWRAGEDGRLEGLEESERARTNVALLNLGPGVADVSVSYLDGRGEVVGGARRVLPPLGGSQESRPFAELAAHGDAAGASARFVVRRGAGVVAWATVIDAASHDVRVVPAAP